MRRYEARWDAQTNRVGVPVKWADMVRDDIWGELKQECEAGAATIDTTWQGQERSALEEFVELRSRDFVGREELLWELEKFAFTLPQSDTWGLCLHGGPGSGKSALFAMLYRKLQKAQASGNFLLLAHAGGISLRAGNVDAMLRRWIQELARYLKLKDDDPSEELKTLEDKKKLFAELLSRASVNTRVVCVIDALNQFERSVVARHLTWLPELWPKNARLITTCIAGSESEALAKRSGAMLRELPRLDEHEAEAIVQSICKRYHRTLNPAIKKCLLDKKTPDNTLSCANPLWLTIAVEQLNLLDEDDFTAADKLEGSPEQKLLAFMLKTVVEFPATIEDLYRALYRRAHERFGQRYGIGWIPELLQFIACSRFGLREKDLEALLCGIEAKKQGKENDIGFAAEFGVNFALQFAAVRRYLSAHLVQRDEMGLWDFMHVQGRKAVQEQKSEEKYYHRLIAEHLEKLLRGDGLKVLEIMWHYFQGDMKENAGLYYGRSDLNTEEKGAATKILAEVVLEGEGKETNAVLAWIGSVLSGIADNESARWFCIKVDFDLHDALEDEGDVGTRIALLDIARMSHERLTTAAPDSAEFARDLSMSYLKLGDLQFKLGKPPEALRYYQQSLSIAEELRKRAPDSAEFARDLSVSYSRLGDLQLKLGKPPEALRYYQQDISIAEELRKRSPDSAEFARDLSVSYSRLGDLQLNLGKPSEALRYYQQSLSIAEELRKRAPDSAEFARDLSVSYSRLGDLQLNLGNPSEALRYYQQCLTIREELRKRAPDSADFARGLSMSYLRLGDLQLNLGNPSEALRYYQQCLTIREELHKRAPDSAEFARDLSASYSRLGELQLKLGKPPEALRYYQQALSIAEELRKRSPDSVEFARDLSVSYNKLGDLQLKLGKPPEALRYYQQALSIAEELRKRSPDSAEFARDLSVSYSRLGELQLKLGKPPEALRYYQQALSIAEELRKRSPDSAEFARDLSVSYSRLGDLQLKLGKPPEALRYYQQSLSIAEELRKRAPDSADFARDLSVSYEKLGDLQLNLGNPSEALRYYQQALAIAEELSNRAPDSADFARDLVVSYYKIASFCNQQNKRQEANKYLALCKKAIIYMKQRNMFVDQPVEQVLQQIEEMGI